MQVDFDIEMKGPLFDGTAPGIAAQMIGAVTEHITGAGHDMVYSFMSEFKSHPTWRWEMELTGAVTDFEHGRIYDTVPYTAWLEGVSSRNLTSRFKGYHMWKISAAWLQQSAPALAETVIALWLPRLGGKGEVNQYVPRWTPGRVAHVPARPGWVGWDNSKFGPRE